MNHYKVIIMLNFIRNVIAIVIPICFTACQQKDAEVSSDDLQSLNVSEMSDYVVQNNTFIDVDATVLSPEVLMNEAPESDLLRQKALYDIASDRFNAHVTVTDGIMNLDLKSGAEINISERLFNHFNAELNDWNETAREAIARGEDVLVCPYPNTVVKIDENGKTVSVEEGNSSDDNRMTIQLTNAVVVKK